MILLTNNEGTVGVPTTARMLAAGVPALDAIEAGIRLIEADPSVRTVGRGGWPNLLCELELDACVMDGATLRTGAVGALKGYLHPVSVAREIMRRLPHEFLVGEGAARFADEIGAQAADNLIEDSRRVWQEWFDRTLTPEQKQAWPDIPLAELCRHAIIFLLIWIPRRLSLHFYFFHYRPCWWVPMLQMLSDQTDNALLISQR